MPDTFFPASQLAETLLTEWEARIQPAFTPHYATRRHLLKLHLAELCRQSLGCHVNLDEDDLRYVLRQAYCLRIGSADGPDRATQLIDSALRNNSRCLPAGPCTEPVVIALLLITYPAEDGLKIDELVTVTESLQDRLGSHTEVIFGYHAQHGLPVGVMRVWVMVGYEKISHRLTCTSSLK